MKNIAIFVSSLLALLPLPSLKAQVPQAFNYQSVLRDAQGSPLEDAALSVRFRILKGSATGPAVFEETHAGAAAVHGLVNLQIGTANPAGFDTISWVDGPLFLEVGVDLENGSDFEVIGAQQLVAVPYALHSRSSSDWLNVGDSVLYNPNSKIGIGTANPVSPLHIAAGGGISIVASVALNEITFKNDPQGSPDPADIAHEGNGFIRFSTGGNERMRITDGGGIRLPTAAGAYEITFANDSNGNPDPADIVHEGAGNIRFWTNQAMRMQINANDGVKVFGSTETHCLTINGGCDITEKTNSTQTLLPGEVIVIDPARPNHVLRSGKAYDRMTIGVISGAGGITQGMMLSQEGMLDGDVAFAIAGRVKVKVTGEVQPGDLLTTSDVPGHAMAAKSRRKRDGAVIGKALSAPDAEGLVLMLVMNK